MELKTSQIVSINICMHFIPVVAMKLLIIVVFELESEIAQVNATSVAIEQLGI